jgi:DNA-binding MarR family transcriptional regulator
MISSQPTRVALLDDLELAAWRGMLQAHARITQQLDAEMRAEHGLSVSAYEVLMFLADAPEHRMRMSDIAQQALLSRSGCTRLVDRLVGLGYVVRYAATNDGRGLYAELTEAGVAKAAVARATHLDGVRRLFLDRLTTTDQVVLGDIWSRLESSAATAAVDSELESDSAPEGARATLR